PELCVLVCGATKFLRFSSDCVRLCGEPLHVPLSTGHLCSPSRCPEIPSGEGILKKGIIPFVKKDPYWKTIPKTLPPICVLEVRLSKYPAIEYTLLDLPLQL
ncbi:unnamed protein product, partial [Sphacelaria rigidula]